jgi:hypothetical protein
MIPQADFSMIQLNLQERVCPASNTIGGTRHAEIMQLLRTHSPDRGTLWSGTGTAVRRMRQQRSENPGFPGFFRVAG